MGYNNIFSRNKQKAQASSTFGNLQSVADSMTIPKTNCKLIKSMSYSSNFSEATYKKSSILSKSTNDLYSNYEFFKAIDPVNKAEVCSGSYNVCHSKMVSYFESHPELDTMKLIGSSEDFQYVCA